MMIRPQTIGRHYLPAADGPGQVSGRNLRSRPCIECRRQFGPGQMVPLPGGGAACRMCFDPARHWPGRSAHSGAGSAP